MSGIIKPCQVLPKLFAVLCVSKPSLILSKILSYIIKVSHDIKIIFYDIVITLNGIIESLQVIDKILHGIFKLLPDINKNIYKDKKFYQKFYLLLTKIYIQ